MTNEEIISFAMKAHGEQKYGNMPYIVHLIMVASHFTDPKLQAIALLHDILEDTDIKPRQLYELFGFDIAYTVGILTRRKKEDYFSYIRRVGRDILAKEVKMADLKSNLFSATYLYPQYSSLKERYMKALYMLEHDVSQGQYME